MKIEQAIELAAGKLAAYDESEDLLVEVQRLGHIICFIENITDKTPEGELLALCVSNGVISADDFRAIVELAPGLIDKPAQIRRTIADNGPMPFGEFSQHLNLGWRKITNERKPNTQECSYFGRKLGNICTDDISVSNGYVVIGSENDDQIYFGDSLHENEKMLKERVMITFVSDDENFSYQIDLEDLLKFSAKHCHGIMKRVMRDEKVKREN